MAAEHGQQCFGLGCCRYPVRRLVHALDEVVQRAMLGQECVDQESSGVDGSGGRVEDRLFGLRVRP